MSDLYSALKRAGLATKLSETVFAAGGQMAQNALQVYLGDSAQALQFDELGLAQVQAAAHLAPFGWGEQTMQDTAVRDTWEVNGSALRLAWQADAEQNLAEQVSRALCLPEKLNFSLSLHKLLLYKPGQFFKPHTDSEKAPGMLATLVLALPSAHRGGLLQVNHGKLQQTFASELMQPGQLNWFAFYADCPHQVLPVESGNRVVLTFNLCIPRQIGMEAFDGISLGNADLIDALEKYTRDNAMPFAFELSHRYSQVGLNWRLMKGSDIRLANAVKTAAKNTGWQVWLAQMSRQSTYNILVEEHEDEFHPSTNNDESIFLFNLIDQHGDQLPSWCTISSGSFWDHRVIEFFPEYFENWKQDDHVSYAGWSGNEGQLIKGWYRSAALIFAKDVYIPPFLNRYYLYQQLKQGLSHNQKSEWQSYATMATSSFYENQYLIPDDILLKIVIALENQDAIRTMLSEFDLCQVSENSLDLLVEFWKKWGDDFFRTCFFARNMSDGHGKASTFLDKTITAFEQAGMSAPLLNEMLDSLLEGSIRYTESMFFYHSYLAANQYAMDGTYDWRNTYHSWAATVASCCRAAFSLNRLDVLERLLNLVIEISKSWLLEFCEAWINVFVDSIFSEIQGFESRLKENLHLLLVNMENHENVIPVIVHCTVFDTHSTCSQCCTLEDFAISNKIQTALTTTPMKAAHMVEQIAFYRLPIASRLQEDGRNSQFQMTKTPQLQIDLADRRQRLQHCIAEFQRRSFKTGSA